MNNPAAAATRTNPSLAQPVALRSSHEAFVAALVDFGTRVGIRAISRASADWDRARTIEYRLLRNAACCAPNDDNVVGELISWDSVSTVFLLDNPAGRGDGVARAIMAPYGRLPAATRVAVRRDPSRVTCEVATLALDASVANDLALHLLWRGIYDHARRGGANEVVWTLAGDLASLLRDRFGFTFELLSDQRRRAAGSTSTVTVRIELPRLETKLARERPAYYGWLTSGFLERERAALGLPIDLTGAYARVCDHVVAQIHDLRSASVPQ